MKLNDTKYSISERSCERINLKQDLWDLQHFDHSHHFSSNSRCGHALVKSQKKKKSPPCFSSVNTMGQTHVQEDPLTHCCMHVKCLVWTKNFCFQMDSCCICFQMKLTDSVTFWFYSPFTKHTFNRRLHTPRSQEQNFPTGGVKSSRLNVKAACINNFLSEGSNLWMVWAEEGEGEICEEKKAEKRSRYVQIEAHDWVQDWVMWSDLENAAAC